MNARELTAQLRRAVDQRADLQHEQFPLEHRAGRFPFLRIASADFGPHDRILLIRAGIHGDEIAGPLTLARDLGGIADQAHGHGLKLIIYPLGNPSGFDAASRYNADGDRGGYGNNCALFYRTRDGRLRDDLGRGRAFTRWYWASDQRLDQKLPSETALMCERLAGDPLRRIVAVADLHQDHLSPIPQPGAYHYACGDTAVFGPILARLRPIIPLLSRKLIGAGQASRMRTSPDGFIARHDGTLGDLFSRLATPYVVTPETLGATPLDLACQVNRIWIDGLIALASAPDADRKRSFAREVKQRIGRGNDLFAPLTTDPLLAVASRGAPPDAPRILLTAGIHGDEPAGVLALLEFLERDLPRYAGRFSFLILPCINSQGFELGIRPGAGGVDINRHFGDDGQAPEARAIKQLLGQYPGPFRLAMDLHETDTYIPPGGGFGVEDNPARFYMYESLRGPGAGVGRRIIASLAKARVPISRRSSIFGAPCQDGLIVTPPPGHPDFLDKPEFVGTLDWYLFSGGFCDHFLATETPTTWPLKRRIQVQRQAIRLALAKL